MSQPLRVGIAGLGTVGAAVLDILSRRENALAERSGRAIVVVGVSARNRNKARGINLSNVLWHDDPVALARSPDIDCLVELIGGEGGPALAANARGARLRQTRRHRQQGDAGAPWVRAGRNSRGARASR